MDRVKVVTSVQRKWRWTAEQNRARVPEAEQSKMSISAVTRKHEIHPPPLESFMVPVAKFLQIAFQLQIICSLSHRFA